MTVDTVQTQDALMSEKPPLTVQNEIQKEISQEAATGGGAQTTQKQILAVLAASVPQNQIQKTAQDQLEKGYLDIKV